MAKFKIIGGKKLEGEIEVSGAKNAALKMVAASIMIDGKTVLHNVPQILDIDRMIEIIESIGAKTEFEGNTLTINSANINSFTPDEGPINKLRGSVVIIGPLLSKFRKATFSQPGGCLIGARPIDTHIAAFSDLGVEIEKERKNGKYHLKAFKSFDNADKTIILEEMSVTTTENLLMASVLRKGTTRIEVAACEPEIADLIDFLNCAGAKIQLQSGGVLVVEGVKHLTGIEHTIIPDRCEIGTFAIATAITNGNIIIKNIIPKHLSLVLKKFAKVGVNFSIENKDNNFADLIINQRNKLSATNIDTRPYPGFPTDLQPQFTLLMTQAKGKSRIFETLFESRFNYVFDLQKMGTDIEIESPHIVKVNGPTFLLGKDIVCTDLRGGATLVLAALAAKGESIINKIEYVDRGYEQFDTRLKSLGADIERIV